MIRVEALADAIGKMNGMLDPETAAYRARNPGLLKIRPGAHQTEHDTNGNMVYGSLQGGYRSLCDRLRKQCGGKYRDGLASTNALRDLLAYYDLSTDASARKIVNFIRRALQDDSITAETAIGFFLE